MNTLALITGASSGIGRELARYHASKKRDVILAARSKKPLADLKKELEDAHGITAHVFLSDLSKPTAAKKLYEDIKKAGLEVGILINNAGFGGHGTIAERDVADDLAMIQVNVSSLVTLTHLFATDMAAQGGGKILQVGSTAGFMPGPNQAVYFATKAFVNSFSQAVDEELRAKGVTSSVLCPGYVETDFAKAANLEGTNMVKAGGKDAATCAKIGYDGMERGKLVIFNELQLNIMLNWVLPFLPRRMALKMMGKMQSK